MLVLINSLISNITTHFILPSENTPNRNYIKSQKIMNIGKRKGIQNKFKVRSKWALNSSKTMRVG